MMLHFRWSLPVNYMACAIEAGDLVKSRLCCAAQQLH